jgi:nitroimidazol reductase NimA-like FMN-containing flavoprotein (pyridoxamine 5'-phosphate oxidase superfamily)
VSKKSLPIHDKEIDELLVSNSQLILSTLNNEGMIHTLPVSYRYRDGEFIIWTFLDRNIVFNIRKNPDVTLLINQEEPVKFVMIYGTAEVLMKDDAAFKEKIIWIFEKHGSKDDALKFLDDFILSEMGFISVLLKEIISYDED